MFTVIKNYVNLMSIAKYYRISMSIRFFLQATQRELEAQTGIPQSLWSRYLSGKKMMSEVTIKKVADCLQVSPGDLLEALYERRRMQKEKKAAKKK